MKSNQINISCYKDGVAISVMKCRQKARAGIIMQLKQKQSNYHENRSSCKDVDGERCALMHSKNNWNLSLLQRFEDCGINHPEEQVNPSWLAMLSLAIRGQT